MAQIQVPTASMEEQEEHQIQQPEKNLPRPTSYSYHHQLNSLSEDWQNSHSFYYMANRTSGIFCTLLPYHAYWFLCICLHLERKLHDGKTYLKRDYVSPSF